CNIKARVAFQILSEDMEPSYWQKLAEMVADELNNGAQGVVIPHGTDTMGYTAAALSFMLKDLSGPVVLVGAQRSSDRPSSDAVQNLTDAVNVASNSDIGEIVVAMHANMSDKKTYIHRGNKVRKFHTSRRDAFKTVNDRPLGTIEKGEIEMTEDYKRKTEGETKIDKKLETDIGIVYSYPGLQPEDIPEKKGLLLIGTGLGHIPHKTIDRIKQLTEKKDMVFAMASQCFFGRVNMNVYSNGRDLIRAGVIPCEDMIPETAYVKLMWSLSQGRNRDEVEKLMKKNISGEITKRSENSLFF
ncbi:MAG: Glu-tRNA(Gln) amidotransferase subunit GatD, partial [Candidatus Thermoplasmatota archaeon]